MMEDYSFAKIKTNISTIPINYRMIALSCYEYEGAHYFAFRPIIGVQAVTEQSWAIRRPNMNDVEYSTPDEMREDGRRYQRTDHEHDYLIASHEFDGDPVSLYDEFRWSEIKTRKIIPTPWSPDRDFECYLLNNKNYEEWTTKNPKIHSVLDDLIEKLHKE